MTMTAKDIVLTDKDQVWDLLKQFATSSLDAGSVRLRFESFPRLNFVFDGPRFEAALPLRVTDAMWEIQNEIYRIYSLLVYNDENVKLSPEEKADLELFFSIGEGSSDAEPKNLWDVLNRAIDKAMTRMDSKHIAQVMISVVACWTIHGIATSYLEKQNITEIETARQNGETERVKLITEMAKQNTAVGKALEAHEEALEAIAKSVKGPEQVTFPDGLQVDEKIAKELYPRERRRKAEETRFDGIFFVDKYDRTGDEPKVQIRNPEGKVFSSKISAIPQEYKDAIALAASQEKSLSLQINAKNLEGELTDLVIVGVNAGKTIAESKQSP